MNKCAQLILSAVAAIQLVACAPDNGPAPAQYPVDLAEASQTVPAPALSVNEVNRSGQPRQGPKVSAVIPETPSNKTSQRDLSISTNSNSLPPAPPKLPTANAATPPEIEQPTFTREIPRAETAAQAPTAPAPKLNSQSQVQAQPKPKTEQAQTYEQELVRLINRSRAQAGLSPLRLNLYQSAGTRTCVGSYGHSVHMQKVGVISHDQFPADICVRTSASAENVGMATGTKESAMRWIHKGMMDEGPGGGHYENIMSTKYDSVGIGLYYQNGTLWLTENFLYLGR